MKKNNFHAMPFLLFFFLIMLPAYAWPQDRGKTIYDSWCSQCHGVKGDGKGYTTDFTFPKPRDFTVGTFKHVTVPTGFPPVDPDIARIIQDGNPGTSMPPWKRLSAADVNALVQYIKKFSPPDVWQYPGKPIKIGKPPAKSANLLAMGRQLYKKAKCWECHGQEGRGDGIKGWQARFRDDWHNKIYPADQTAPWDYIDGSSLTDVYTTITAGIGGTPLTTYGATLTDQQRWALAYFVQSEQLKRRLGLSLEAIMVKDLPSSTTDPVWDKVPYLDIPLAGQIIFDPRNFMPIIDNVRVRGVYANAGVEIMLEWTCKQASFLSPAEMEKAAAALSPGGGGAPGAGHNEPAPGAEGGQAAPGETGATAAAAENAVVYPDAARLQFPSKATEGAEPYFFGGDGAHQVNVWLWKVSDKNRAVEFNGAGPASLTEQARQDVQVTEAYKDGQYRVIFRRPLNTGDKDDTVFEAGKFMPFEISLYDGRNGEQGNKCAISAWYFMVLEPPTPAKVYYLPAVVFIIVLLLGIILHRMLRRKGNPEIRNV